MSKQDSSDTRSNDKKTKREIMKENAWSEGKKPRWRQRSFIALLLSGAALLLIGALLGFLLSRQYQPASQATSALHTPDMHPTNSGAGSPQAQGNPPAVWPTKYKDTVKQGIAEQLNLSIAQIKEKVSRPQVSLFAVTTGQGFQSNEVLPLWLNVLQSAGNLMIKMRIWTPQQATDYWQYWNEQQESAAGQKNIDAALSHWFTES